MMTLPELKDRVATQAAEEVLALRQLAQSAPPITTNAERLGGTPVIGINRVPVTALIDAFTSGQTLDEFLDDFPAVEHHEALAALDRIRAALEAGWLAERVTY